MSICVNIEYGTLNIHQRLRDESGLDQMTSCPDTLRVISLAGFFPRGGVKGWVRRVASPVVSSLSWAFFTTSVRRQINCRSSLQTAVYQDRSRDFFLYISGFEYRTHYAKLDIRLLITTTFNLAFNATELRMNI